MIVTYSTTP